MQATAYHEAGHAVVAWLCNHQVGSVTVVPDAERGTAGLCRHNDEGCSDLFGPGELYPHPSEPDSWVVRTGGNNRREMTDAERVVQCLLDEYLDVDFDERHVMVAAGGEAAQRRVAPQHVHEWQSTSDWESVQEHLERLSSERRASLDAVRAELTGRTVELLDSPHVWRIVVAVAAALVKAGTLTRAELTQVIQTAVRGAPPWDAAQPDDPAP